jgi:cytochrome c553
MARARTLRIVAVVVFGGAIAIIGGALLFAWSGVYSVAASRGHWPFVSAFLDFGMRSSVRTHALGISAPDLDDINLIRLGAGHFHGGCAYCHGGPGVPINPIAQHMLPAPPALSSEVDRWEANELYWIVKNGLKYTGMPAWSARTRDDEVWAVVAFLQRLPRLDEQGYKELVFGEIELPPLTASALASPVSNSQAPLTCARCHGWGRTGPASDLVPILHGQSSGYLRAALKAYSEGTRASGFMEPVVSELDEASIGRMAEYYAGLDFPAQPSPSPPPDDAAIERGRLLAIHGDPDDDIPACTSCHGSAALAIFPRLAGQHARYMKRRLALWKRGLNPPASDIARIMAPIAKRLTDQQMRDVSFYYAAQSRSQPDQEGRK